ncbi:MAG: choice-of-anchor D domain-containing protein [Pirellulaceae bacterium]|nr:choice-of-anchor D domain-containing protein [Pirellulaceae bacterium]
MIPRFFPLGRLPVKAHRWFPHRLQPLRRLLFEPLENRHLLAGPEIAVFDWALNIPSTATVDFGTIPPTQWHGIEKQFTVHNLGDAPLNFTIPATMPSGFTLLTPAGNYSLPAGDSMFFEIRLNGNPSGSSSGSISIDTNDSDENPFVLGLKGQVTTTPNLPAKIIDDGDVGFSASAGWTTTTGGYQDDVRTIAGGTGGQTATWEFGDLPNGIYRIWATWPADTNRPSSAAYQVFDAGDPRGEHPANQQVAPNDLNDANGWWTELGDADILSGTLQVRLSDQAASTQFVAADAIRIQRISDLSSIDEFTIDDGNTGFSTSGTWNVSSNGYDGDLRTNAAGSGTDKARWTFNVSPGMYEVWATWYPQLGNSAASNAPFAVFDGQTPRGTMPVDQRFVPNDVNDGWNWWESLGGPFEITSLSTQNLVVELTDNANGSVIADAVRIQRVLLPAPVPGPEIEVRSGAANVSDGGTLDFGSTSPGTSVERSLTIKNVGSDPLELVSLSQLPSGFSVTPSFAAGTLASGESVTYAVSFQSETPGVYQGTVSLGSNDADEDPFEIFLTGQVLAVPEVDVEYYLISKGCQYVQSGTESPNPAAGTPYFFYSQVAEAANGAATVSNASLRTPSGSTKTLVRNAFDQTWEYQAEFATKSSLDSSFRSGAYQFTIVTLHQGSQKPSIELPTDAYPSPPRVSNWTEAQSLIPNADFLMTWDAFATGSADDFIQLCVYASSGQAVFCTPEPYEADAFDGTKTSVVIPADTFISNQSYTAELMFVKNAGWNTTSHPGAVGVAAYVSLTEFAMQTVSAAPPAGLLQFSASDYRADEPDGQVTITVNRIGGTQGEVSVNYATDDGTATAGADYETSQGMLVFADGVVTQTFTVNLVDDDDVEGNETVHLTLSEPTGGAALGIPVTAVLTIADDEVTVGPGTYLDEDGDSYTIKLSGPGEARIRLDDPDGNGSGPINTILLTGTTAKSSLSVTVKKATGGDGKVAIGRVVGDGDLKSLSASKSDLTGTGIEFRGWVGQIAMGDLKNQSSGVSQIVLGGNPDQSTKISFGDAPYGANVHLGAMLGALTARSLLDGLIEAPAISALSTTAGSLCIDLEVAGAVKSVSVKNGSASGAWQAASFGTVSVSGGGFAGNLAATATAASLGKTPAISGLSVSGGNLELDLVADGAVKSVSVKSGSASGAWQAASFGTVSVSGGGFEGDLIATATAASLGKTAAIGKLAVTGGDIAAHLHALGKVGTVQVSKDKAGAGGSMLDAHAAAAAFGTFSIGKNLANCVILAGANLGDDFEVAGTGGNADTFGPGSISKFSVGGQVRDSMVGAGLDPMGLVFRNGNDEIAGGTASKIGSFSITGTAGNEDYFRAGAWPKTVKVGGASVSPATDSRFLDLQNFWDCTTTSEDGRALLQIAGKELPLQLLDGLSGHPVPGLQVAVSTGTGAEGLAVLEVFDPTDQYPPRFVVLHGTYASGPEGFGLASVAEEEGGDQEVAVSIFDRTSFGAELVEAIELPRQLPKLAAPLKVVSSVSGVLEAFGKLAKVTDKASGGLVSKQLGQWDAAGVKPIGNQDALREINDKAKDDTLKNLAIAGVASIVTGNPLPLLKFTISLGVTEVIRTMDEHTVLECPEGQLYVTRLGNTELYSCSALPALPAWAPAPVIATSDGSPVSGGYIEMISQQRWGVGLRAPLDGSGHADVAVPPNEYTLQHIEQGRPPFRTDVVVPQEGTPLNITLPSKPQVAHLTLKATPGITGLLDPGSQIRFTVEAKKAGGEIIPLDELPCTLSYQVFNPVGSQVGNIAGPQDDPITGPGTGVLTVGSDQGAARVVAACGTVRSNLALVSGLGPAFNLPVILIGDASVVEGNSGTRNCVFNVQLSKASAQTVTVDYNTAYVGSASPTSDYTDVTGTLKFAPGKTSAQILVPVKGDNQFEGDEQFAVGLSNPVNARLDLKNSAAGTIVDDDFPGITVSPTSGLITTESAGRATFSVKLNSQPTADVTIALASSDITEGTVAPTSLTFTSANWSTARTVTVTGVDDSQIDGDIPYQVAPTSVTSADPIYADPALYKPTINVTNRDNDVLGKGKVYVTVVGNGYVIDSTGQIDTRDGRNLGTYSSSVQDIWLAASTPSGFMPDSVIWVYPNGSQSDSTAPELVTPSDWPNGLALTVYIDVQPLLADRSAAMQTLDAQQTPEEGVVAGLLRQASLSWAATDLNLEQQMRLDDIELRFMDLPGPMVGGFDGRAILLDRDAAGFGWYLDDTPRSHEEFVRTARTSSLALSTRPAGGRMDMLTVLMHELGHLLGFEDLDPADDPDHIMAGTLSPGIRRIPWPTAADAAFAAWRS